jgi:GNAT superfamily N-acetyltransferase
MLAPVTVQDLPEIRALIASAIRHSVANSEEDATFLINDVDESLDWWRGNQQRALHLKYSVAGDIVGVVLVKEFWNLTNLFVSATHQGQGIGRLLLKEALEVCRHQSPRGAVLLNSSTVAAGFYRHLGFRQLGSGRDRPGGCVPFSYDFVAG